MNSTTKNAEETKKRQEHTLRTIARLQNMEQDLYRQLSQDYKSGKFTTTTPAKHCANENQQCICPKGSTVEYGVGNTWRDKSCPENGMIGCNNKVFGDPAVGKRKACRIKASSVQDMDKIKSMVDRINELSQTRINLFESLKNDYEDKQDLVKGTHENLVKQYTNAKIVEHKMNNTKQHMKAIQQDNYNKLRMVQINQYSSDKYYAYSKLFKLFVVIMIPIVIIGSISKSNIIPDRHMSRESINDLLLLILLVIICLGLYFILQKYSDISSRNNMNFQEYDWNFDPKSQPGVIAYDEEELDLFKKNVKTQIEDQDNKYRLNKKKKTDSGFHPLQDIDSGINQVGHYGSVGLHKLGGLASSGLHGLDSMGNSLINSL
jgi:hypothetical protein